MCSARLFRRGRRSLKLPSVSCLLPCRSLQRCQDAKEYLLCNTVVFIL